MVRFKPRVVPISIGDSFGKLRTGSSPAVQDDRS